MHRRQRAVRSFLEARPISIADPVYMSRSYRLSPSLASLIQQGHQPPLHRSETSARPVELQSCRQSRAYPQAEGAARQARADRRTSIPTVREQQREIEHRARVVEIFHHAAAVIGVVGAVLIDMPDE